MGKHKNANDFASRTRKRSSKSRSARLRWKNKKAACSSSDISVRSDQEGTSMVNVTFQDRDNEEVILSTSGSPVDVDDVPSSSYPMEKKQCEEEITPTRIPSFIPEDEFNRIMEHELCIEPDTSPKEASIHGNRIVDLQYVLNWSLTLQYEHSKICTCGKIFLISEGRWGLGMVSKLEFGCNMCDKKYTYFTEDPTNKSKINYGFVWGTLATGSTFGHSEELLSVMDVPCMTLYNFKKIEAELGDVWKNALIEEMEEAGKEEYRLATENGCVDQDGIPYITVFLDGGWSKRSYGHSYNAASGVAVIIGRETKKLLFLGVRNKYCSICARAANRKSLPNEHICYRNWSSSSSAMEADIITEGFRNSIKMHGVRYKTFIADGDSSVFARIRQNVEYGLDVQKIECVNHVIKNYGKGLRKIKEDKNINLQARKLLTHKKIVELEDTIQSVVCTNANGDIETLKNDIQNTPFHVYGCHLKCQHSYCPENGKSDNQLDAVKSTGLLLHINGLLDLVLKKSHKLIDNETNNRAELFMSILARFNAGKRLNLTQRGSFESRSHLTGLRYNKGFKWHSKPWKSAITESPGTHFKLYMDRQTKKHNLDAARRSIHLEEKSQKKATRLPNLDYGPQAEEPELSETEMDSEKDRILKQFQLTEEEDKAEIQIKTIGQYENEFYINYKKNRLTASYFGMVVKRMDHTPCHNLVKAILYGTVPSTPAMEYGKMKEPMVKARFSEEHDVIIRDCGLFIDSSRGYLGASPDGLIGNDTLIEVKCLYKVAQEGMDLQSAVKKYKNLCLETDNVDQLRLKRNHNYYYQIQGQLNIANKSTCIFIVYSGDKNPLYFEEIGRDETFWEEKMVPKLDIFFLNCILPEIIRKNIPKGKKCQDPQYIIDAQLKKKPKEIAS